MKSAWKNETHVVLDACALIAFLNDEPGSEVVAAVLQEAPSVEISVVNLLEIAYDAVRRSGDPQSARESWMRSCKFLSTFIGTSATPCSIMPPTSKPVSAFHSQTHSRSHSQKHWVLPSRPATTMNSITSKPMEWHASFGSARRRLFLFHCSLNRCFGNTVIR